MSTKIIDFNAETGEEIVRDMTEEELAYLEDLRRQQIAKDEACKAKEASRTAILSKLGLTEEEAKLLFS